MVGVRTRAKTLAMAAAAEAEEKARSRRRRRRRRKKKSSSETAAELRISYPPPPPPRVKARSGPNSKRRRRPSLDLDTASCGADREPPQFGEFDPSRICCGRGGGGRINEARIPNIRINGSARRSAVEMAPSETEIEEFFMTAERAEQSRFIDKYNYDIINDAPFEGRYEWGFE